MLRFVTNFLSTFVNHLELAKNFGPFGIIVSDYNR